MNYQIKTKESIIKQIANNSWGCKSISLSTFCRDGNELEMSHDIVSDKLEFRYTDNSKPLYYQEYCDGKVVDKRFNDKYKMITYNYPYFERTIPAGLKTNLGNPISLEYIIVKERKVKIQDFCEVENIIHKVLDMIKNQ